MKKNIVVLTALFLALIMICTSCGGSPAKDSGEDTQAEAQTEVQETAQTDADADILPDTQAEILAVYSCPNTQIITGPDNEKELADTVIFLHRDFTYTQYVDHEDRYEKYSTGSYELNFEPGKEGWEEVTPHVLTVYPESIHGEDHQLTPVEGIYYDIDLDRIMDFCLYPDKVLPDRRLTAAFMQTGKQKLVKTDGSEEYLPTIWFYYDDGTFEQHAIVDEETDVLFSTGDYSVTDEGFTDDSVLTIHRNKKYQDGAGLSEYDSTHDYLIGELDFIRIYPLGNE
ncbi:MAG: hypothetical protein II705_05640 [Clostridia bacterium]|nr:hypothetical protein [Clostridia bacterium]